jgi:exodeoxyribonuclease III
VRIANFNINGVNRRLDHLLGWLAARKPDIVCLQELKVPEPDFPRAAVEAAGYGAVWRSESAWNGVVILARDADPVLVRTELPGDPSDRQRRYIEAAVRGILVASILGGDARIILRWFNELRARDMELRERSKPVRPPSDRRAPASAPLSPLARRPSFRKKPGCVLRIAATGQSSGRDRVNDCR